MTARTAPGGRDVWITLAALAALLAWEAAGWDLAVARWYGGSEGFVWRDAWLTSTLAHQGGRWLAWAVLAWLVIDGWAGLLHGPTRRERLRWLGVTLAALLLVPAIKQSSTTSCPWDLAEFGGVASYVPHWQLGLGDGGAGHCFPSGHAVAAFAFFSGYFLWRRHRPAFARGWLVAVLMLGLVFGWAQLARGAHFPSHTFWSAWLCWTLYVASERVMPLLTSGRRRAVLSGRSPG